VRHDFFFSHCLSGCVAVTCDDVPAYSTIGQVIWTGVLPGQYVRCCLSFRIQINVVSIECSRIYEVLAVIPKDTDSVTAAIAEIVMKGSSLPT
jgi:hypothetical protein